MPIVLTDEQARILRQTQEPVELRDPQGRPLALAILFDPVEVEMIERSREALARGEPGIPSEQVQAFLRRLHEIAETEGIDERKLKDLLRRRRAGEEI
jgi:hypothetical protein